MKPTCLVTLAAVLTCMDCAAGLLSERGYDLVNERAAAVRSQFYVYQDADSGANHAFPSGIFFEDEADLAFATEIIIDPVCVVVTEGARCATSPGKVNRDRGTVLRIAFPALSLYASEFVGLHFEEPEHRRAGRDSNLSDHGYDLRGVQRLIFDVRALEDSRIGFEVNTVPAVDNVTASAAPPTINPDEGPTEVSSDAGGGGSAVIIGEIFPIEVVGRFIELEASPDFAEICIAVVEGAQAGCPAQSRVMRLSSVESLENVHFLFSVVSKDENGADLLFDNIRFEPAPTARRAGALGLPLSTRIYGMTPDPTTTPTDGVVSFDVAARNIAATYEAALSVLALLERGTVTDLASAKLIADALVYAHQNDQPPPLSFPVIQSDTGGLTPANGGGVGFHNAYMSGDIAFHNDQNATVKSGQVRLPGFSGTQQLCGPTKYCLAFEGATGGNNAYAILALVAAYRKWDEAKYLTAAESAANWVDDVLRDDTGEGFGGYWLGYERENPTEISGGSTSVIFRDSKSGENNAAIFAAFGALSEAFSAKGNKTKSTRWRTRANIAGDFVKKLFRSQTGCFSAGAVARSTLRTFGIRPDGATQISERINTAKFLDANTTALLAMAAAPRYRDSIPWHRVVDCIESLRSTTTATEDERTFEGYTNYLISSDERNLFKPSGPLEPVGRLNGVAWEFTGQAIVAMRFLDALPGRNRYASKISRSLQMMDKARRLSPDADKRGLVASTVVNGHSIKPSAQCLRVPFQCIPQRIGLAATLWGLFADVGSNPLLLARLHSDRDALPDVWDEDDDNDGMSDKFERRFGLNPTDPGDGRDDLDADGLINREEARWGTHPREKDSDGDGIEDGEEVRMNRRPDVNEPSLLPSIDLLLQSQ